MSLMRSSISITWAVWKALFLREAVARLFAGRAAWVWILAEPIVHLLFLLVLFGLYLKQVVSGIDGGLFIMTGLLGFFMVQNTALRCKDAIDANAALFAYRQVLAVDTVLVRATVEAVLLLLCALVLLAGLGLLGYKVVPQNFLLVMLSFAALWLAGIGLGLVLSVGSELIPEVGKVAGILFRPLYFLSSVMYPASAISPAYRDWFLLNPLLHGIETLRAGFFPQYHVISGVSLAYLVGFAMVTVFLGLALHVRFAPRLIAQ
jgi:capsular polysaccharide transport system permease protein